MVYTALFVFLSLVFSKEILLGCLLLFILYGKGEFRNEYDQGVESSKCIKLISVLTYKHRNCMLIRASKGVCPI